MAVITTAVTERTAAQCPGVQTGAPLAGGFLKFADAASSVSGTAPASKNFAAGMTGGLAARLNENALRSDVLARFGGGACGVCEGLALSAENLTVTVAAGQASVCGIVEIAVATNATLTAGGRCYVWLLQGGQIRVLPNAITAPTEAPAVYLGQVETTGGIASKIDVSGVVYVRGGQRFRATADTDAPSDTPPAQTSVMTKTTAGLFLWDGAAHRRIDGGGSGGGSTITLPLDIDEGGTGATTSAGARANLGAGTLNPEDAVLSLLGGRGDLTINVVNGGSISRTGQVITLDNAGAGGGGEGGGVAGVSSAGGLTGAVAFAGSHGNVVSVAGQTITVDGTVNETAAARAQTSAEQAFDYADEAYAFAINVRDEVVAARTRDAAYGWTAFTWTSLKAANNAFWGALAPIVRGTPGRMTRYDNAGARVEAANLTNDGTDLTLSGIFRALGGYKSPGGTPGASYNGAGAMITEMQGGIVTATAPVSGGGTGGGGAASGNGTYPVRFTVALIQGTLPALGAQNYEFVLPKAYGNQTAYYRPVSVRMRLVAGATRGGADTVVECQCFAGIGAFYKAHQTLGTAIVNTANLEWDTLRTQDYPAMAYMPRSGDKIRAKVNSIGNGVAAITVEVEFDVYDSVNNPYPDLNTDPTDGTEIVRTTTTDHTATQAQQVP